jgi:Fe-S cluster biogenesis protein NfuA
MAKKIKKNISFKARVQKALTQIRPSLKAHGGNVKLLVVDEKKGAVLVKLQGMCAGCPMAEVTLKEGIEKYLKKEVKGVKRVEGI